MKKSLLLMTAIAFTVNAKDYNPTCKSYNENVSKEKSLGEEVKQKEENLQSYDRQRYSKKTIKTLKKEIKNIKSQHDLQKDLIKSASKSLNKRIKELKTNFDKDITVTSEQIMSLCSQEEYSDVQLSKILLKQVVSPVSITPVINDPDPALMACMSKLEQIQQRLAGNVDDSDGTIQEIRTIIDFVESSPIDEEVVDQ